MADIGEIRAKITLNARDFNAKIDQVKDKTKTTSVEVDNLRNAFMGMSAVMTGAITASVATAAKFETSMAKLQAVSGATAKEFEMLKNQAAELGATTAHSASQVAEGQNFLAMAGFKANEIIKAMPSVLNLATAAQMDLARTSDITSNILTGFGLSAEETARVADVMAKTMTSSNTNVEQLGYAMKYVAPIAASLGVSIEETAATIGRLSDAGIQGEMAGTVLRGILSSLVAPSKKASETMEELGLNVKDANGELLPLPDIINNLRNGFEGLTKAQKATAAETLVGREAVSGLLSLMATGGENIAAFTTELENAAGATERLAEAQADTLNGSIKELQSALEMVGITVGNMFAPAIRNVAESLSKAALGFDGMEDSTQKAIVAFATATPVAGTLVTGLYAVRTAVVAIGLSVPVLGALTLAISGAVAAYTHFKAKSDEAKNAMEEQKQAQMDVEANSQNLIQRYNELASSMANLDEGSAEAVRAKYEMADILRQLEQLAPGVTASFGAQAGALNSLGAAYSNARLKAIDAAQAFAQAKISIIESQQENLRQDMSDDFFPSWSKNKELGDLENEKREYKQQIKQGEIDRKAFYDVQRELTRQKNPGAVEDAYKELNKISGMSTGGYIKKGAEGIAYLHENELVINSETYENLKKFLESPATYTSKKQEIPDDVNDSYRGQMSLLNYSKSIGSLSLEQELKTLKKLHEQYKQYGDIRMDLEQDIFRVKEQMGQADYDHSAWWTENETRKMELAGNTEKEIAQMRIAAFTRMLRYADKREQVEQSLHNEKMRLMRIEEQEQREMMLETERNMDRLKDNVLDNLRQQEKAELDSLSRRKKELDDYYDSQLEAIDEEERTEERQEVIAELEKYRMATSKDGIRKRKELEDRLRRMNRDDQRREIRAERDQKLQSLREQERDVRSHYAQLMSQVEDFNGGRLDEFKTTNDAILSALKEFVDKYNKELAKMKKPNGTYGPQPAPSNPSTGDLNWGSKGGGSSTYTPPSNTKDTTGNGTVDVNDWYTDLVESGKSMKEAQDIIRNSGKYHTGGIVGRTNFAFGDRLLPDEIASILQKDELVFQPQQLGDLLNASKGGGTTNNYYAPLIESGDVSLHDEADVSTYWRERELAAQRLMSGGDR